jgi:hypothetical protein
MEFVAHSPAPLETYLQADVAGWNPIVRHTNRQRLKVTGHVNPIQVYNRAAPPFGMLAETTEAKRHRGR